MQIDRSTMNCSICGSHFGSDSLLINHVLHCTADNYDKLEDTDGPNFEAVMAAAKSCAELTSTVKMETTEVEDSPIVKSEPNSERMLSSEQETATNLSNKTLFDVTTGRKFAGKLPIKIEPGEMNELATERLIADYSSSLFGQSSNYMEQSINNGELKNAINFIQSINNTDQSPVDGDDTSGGSMDSSGQSFNESASPHSNSLPNRVRKRAPNPNVELHSSSFRVDRSIDPKRPKILSHSSEPNNYIGSVRRSFESTLNVARRREQTEMASHFDMAVSKQLRPATKRPRKQQLNSLEFREVLSAEKREPSLICHPSKLLNHPITEQPTGLAEDTTFSIPKPKLGRNSQQLYAISKPSLHVQRQLDRQKIQYEILRRQAKYGSMLGVKTPSPVNKQVQPTVHIPLRVESPKTTNTGAKSLGLSPAVYEAMVSKKQRTYKPRLLSNMLTKAKRKMYSDHAQNQTKLAETVPRKPRIVFVCNICSQPFASMNLLSRHSDTHVLHQSKMSLTQKFNVPLYRTYDPSTPTSTL